MLLDTTRRQRVSVSGVEEGVIFFIFVYAIVMAHSLLASCRNWCSFAQVLNFPRRRTLLTNFAVFFGRSRVDTVSCLPMLRCKSISSVQRNDFSSCSILNRWQTFVNVENSLGCVREFSFSKIMYTRDEHDERSGMTVNGGDSSDNSDTASEGGDRVSSDSADDSIKVSRFEAGSADKVQPVSDIDVDKELLRYDYEEFELIPDEEVSVVQPVKKSVRVELKRKWQILFLTCIINEC